jgi:hypothetical protein
VRAIIGVVTGGGIAAFFFFSWIIQLLWNSLVAGHLGWSPRLSYLQAAGLWFLVTLLFAWVGIGAGRYVYRRRLRDWEELGRRVETRIKAALHRWVEGEAEGDWEELGKKIEEKLKKKFKEWLGEE